MIFTSAKSSCVRPKHMTADQTPERLKLPIKSIGIRDVYRKALVKEDLRDQEIDAMRQHVIRFAQAICEHVWGKRLY